MGKRRKKSKTIEQVEEESEDLESEEVADTSVQDLQIEFDFCEPDESDYHGVGELLKRGSLDFVTALNYAELVDTIVNQGNIGTLIKADKEGDDEAVCACLTVLNLQQFKQLSWPKEIVKALLTRSKAHAPSDVHQKFEAFISTWEDRNDIGLLLNERFVNLPLDLIPPLHKGLPEDIEWSRTTPECPEDERLFYNFKFYVGVARQLEELPPTANGGEASASNSLPGSTDGLGQRKRKRKQKEAASSSNNGKWTPVFVNPEDEAYVRRALYSFTFSMPRRSREDGSTEVKQGGKEHRVVYVITRSAFEKTTAELESTLKTES